MWVAEFNDETKLTQFQENKEIPFRCVLDRQENLRTLSVLLSNDVVYTVNLQTGKFSLTRNGITVNFFLTDQSLMPPPEYKYRVVYFERCLHLFDNKLKQINGMQVQCTLLGWQTTTPEGKNLKRIIKIYPNDTFDVEVD